MATVFETQPISIRLPAASLEEAKRISERLGVTRAQILRDALEAGLGVIEARPEIMRNAGRQAVIQK